MDAGGKGREYGTPEGGFWFKGKRLGAEPGAAGMRIE
jgi:hypothetical protein